MAVTSLIVTDFVSADYGWLHSSDGKEDAQVLLKVGSSWEDYFTNNDILRQTLRAMHILETHYPNDDHIFIFDNAACHSPVTMSFISRMRSLDMHKLFVEFREERALTVARDVGSLTKQQCASSLES